MVEIKKYKLKRVKPTPPSHPTTTTPSSSSEAKQTTPPPTKPPPPHEISLDQAIEELKVEEPSLNPLERLHTAVLKSCRVDLYERLGADHSEDDYRPVFSQIEMYETGKKETTHSQDLIKLFMNDKIVINEGLKSTKIEHPVERVETFDESICGACLKCEQQVKGGLHAMKNHLLNCAQVNSNWTDYLKYAKDVSVGLMIYPKNENKWNQNWLFVEQSFASNLLRLDVLLRQDWDDTHFHTSLFQMTNGFHYVRSPYMVRMYAASGCRIMKNAQLFNVLKASQNGLRFNYEYNGAESNTELTVEVIYIRMCKKELEDSPCELARSNPSVKCCVCNEQATHFSIEHDSKYYCIDHVNKMDKSQHYWLLCNSPRLREW